MSERREKERRLQERRHQALVGEIRAAQRAPAWRESSVFFLLGAGIALVTWALDPPLFVRVASLIVAWLCFCGAFWIVFREVEFKSRLAWEVVSALLTGVTIYVLWALANGEVELVAKLSIESDKEFLTVPQDKQPFPPKVSKFARIKVVNAGEPSISNVKAVVVKVNNQDEALQLLQLPLSSIDNRIDMPNPSPIVASANLNSGEEQYFDVLIECNGYAGCQKGELAFLTIENGRRLFVKPFGAGYATLEEFTVRASGEGGASVVKTFTLVREPNGKLQLKSNVNEEMR